MTAADITAPTAAGRVAGQSDGTTMTFLGIPYAARPTGPRRFLPPAPPAGWTGTRDATAYGPRAPQLTRPSSGRAAVIPADSGPTDEDCLRLNVWTPSLAGKRPVLVWLHGGGFFAGSGSWSVTDGRALARQHDVTVVSVNHRLGLLGHLYLGDALGPDYATSGNTGMLDLVAALTWVRDNIEGFGGDPDCVTIFGQSGGAGKVLALLAMPAARGLFHRAIMQSGTSLQPGSAPGLDLAGAADVAGQALKFLDLSRDDPRQLLELPAERLLAAQAELMKNWTPGSRGGRSFRPVVDGVSLPVHPWDALAGGQGAPVPVMIGSTLDETRLFLYEAMPAFSAAPAAFTLAEDELTRRVAAHLDEPAAARAVIAHYRSTHPGASALDVYSAITSDFLRVGAAEHAERKLAGAQRTDGYGAAYVYLFAWRSPLFGGALGASHTFELPFLFGTLDEVPATAAGDGRLRVAAAVSGSWAQFARTGQPGHDLTGRWPAYTLGARPTMVFDTESGVRDDPLGTDRDFWMHMTSTDRRLP
jgi:para-nitrobenzyl esterase